MDFLIYFTFYFLLLIASSIIINGFFISARGKKEVQVDGTIKKTGNILRSWHFFWTKEKEYMLCVFYDLPHLTEFIDGINANYFNNKPQLKIANIDSKPFDGKVSVNRALFDLYFKQWEQNYPDVKLAYSYDSVVIVKEEDVDLEIMTFYPYQEEVLYVFPWWVRKMMSSCVTCHASLYGSVLFWAFHFFCRAELLRGTIYAFADADKFWPVVFCTWIAQIFSLAYLNTFFHKKVAQNG